MTDELKKALSEANTEAEKKAVVEKFKDEIRKLSDEQLEGIAGGAAEETGMRRVIGPLGAVLE